MSLPQKERYSDVSLMHYGVKGMKWGVRKREDGGGGSGPLSREARAARLTARIAKSDVRIGELKKEIDAIPTGGGWKQDYQRGYRISDKRVIQDQRDVMAADLKAINEGRLTSTQKKLIVGGLLAGAALGYVAYQGGKESGAINSARLRAGSYIRGKSFAFNKNDKYSRTDMDPDTVLSDVVKGLNPNYNNAGGQMNCRRCSFTYELRRRGFDVDATATRMGWGQSESGVINAVTGGKRNKYGAQSLSESVAARMGIRTKLPSDTRVNPGWTSSLKSGVKYTNAGILMGDTDRVNGLQAFSKSIVSSLKDNPSGSRGEIVFDFKDFGHSMSWEKFGDRVVIFDTQKAQKYDLSSPLSLIDMANKWGVPLGSEMTRLDDMDLDYNFLSRWATNRK